MPITGFRQLKDASRVLGKVVNSRPVSTVAKALVKGGSIAEKVLDNPMVAGLATDSGPEGMALYGALQAGARGSQQLGKGIQKAKGQYNSSAFGQLGQ